VPDLVDELIRGDIPLVCQTAAGELTTNADRPAALLCGSFNPLHDGHLRLAACAAARLQSPVAFEIGVVNADKPPLAADEVRRRLAQFVGRGDVWLTRQPNFLGKSHLFPGAVFVIGYDTAVRVLDPRFYGGHDAAVRAALATLDQHRCRFLVAGRTDPSGRFQPAEELPVADDFRSLFCSLTEAEFRSDLSSTAFRLFRK
jgi:Cytidylyltransferase-like